MLYIDIDRELVRLDETITRLRARLSAPATQRITNMPKAVSACPDAMVETIAKVCELQKKYNDRWDLLIDLQARIEESIDTLEPLERLVMRERYIAGRPWERIASAIPCSWSTVHRIHRQALRKLEMQSISALRQRWNTMTHGTAL